MADTIEIPIKVTGLADAKKQLKDVKDEIIQLSQAEIVDPAKLAEATKRAGALKDAIKDVNDQVAVMASGSGFEKISNNLGLIGSQLKDLDFTGAADSAKLLVANIKALNPSEVANQFKGFISVIGSLGNAFIQMGIKLLANPLFLLVAVVAAVVVAIVLLKDKIKIVEVAFDLLVAPIKILIQGLKDLGDWLGITQFALEEQADAAEKSANRQIEANKKISDSVNAEYDYRIKLGKAQGQKTTELELEQQKFNQKIAKENIANAQKVHDLLIKQRSGETEAQQKETNKRIAELRKTIGEESKVYKNAGYEQNLIKANANKDAAEAQKKANEKSLEEQKKAGERAAELERYNLQVLSDIRDLEVDNMEEGFNKQLALITRKNEKELELITANHNKIYGANVAFTQAELTLIETTNENYKINLSNQTGIELRIRAEKNKEIENLQEDFYTNILDLELQNRIDEAKLRGDKNTARSLEEVQSYAALSKSIGVLIEQSNEIRRKIEEEGQIKLNQAVEEARMDHINDIKALGEEASAEELKAEDDAFADRLAHIYAYHDEEVVAMVEGDEQILKIKEESHKQLLNFLGKAAEEELKLQLETIAKYLEESGKLIGEIGNLIGVLNKNKLSDAEDTAQAELDILEAQKQKELDTVGNNGKAREAIERNYAQKRYEAQLKAYDQQEKIKKKQFETDKAFSLAQIAINTAIAISKSVAESPITFGLPWSAFAAAIGAVQFAAVLATKYNAGEKPSPPSSSSFSSGGFSGTGDETGKSISPNQTVLVGKQFELNEVTGGFEPKESAKSAITVKAIVVESDITGAQHQITHIENLSQLGG